MTTDAWLTDNRWIYYSNGTVTERPLYRTSIEREDRHSSTAEAAT